MNELVDKIIDRIRKYDELTFKVNGDDALSERLMGTVKDNSINRKVSKEKTSSVLFEIGKAFFFGEGQNGSFILGNGWHRQETSGVWSKSNGELLLNLPVGKDSELEICFGFCNSAGDLNILFNGNVILTVINDNRWDKSERIVLSNELFKDGLQKLTLHSVNSGTLAGFNEQVGIFLKSISFVGLEKDELHNTPLADYAFENILSKLSFSKASIQNNINDVRVAADCPLPEKTRFRFFKRVIRKFMRPFILFQLEFNRKICDVLRLEFNETTALIEKNLEIQSNQQKQMMQLSDKIEASLAQLNNKVDASEKSQQEFAVSHLSEREIFTTDIMTKLQSLDKEFQNQWTFNQYVNENFNVVWNHSKDTNNNLNSVWSTYQSLRRELFYELDFRLRAQGCEVKAEKVESKVKESYNEKLKQSGGVIKLNLGSGPFEKESYISVDARDLPNIDIVSDVAKLPFEEKSVDEIFSAHMLEHFESLVLENELLPYWFSLLKTGGRFIAIVPDLDAMAKQYNDGNMTFDELAEAVMGSQDYKLDYHYSVFSPERLIKMLQKVGFGELSISARGRKNGQCYETEVSAIKL